MLLEGLIAIVLFSMGILALMGLQAVAIKNTADAKYRAEAAFLANQIIGQMWADNPNILTSYTTPPPGNGNVTAWLVSAAGSLPNGTGVIAVVTVPSVPPTYRVTVTISWQGPQETVPHSHVAEAQING